MDAELTEEKKGEIIWFCRENQDATFDEIAAHFGITPKQVHALFLDSLVLQPRLASET